tara:strand:- start:1194 stop:1892 length:699 start_codon:yes stop_codon:yes gene_type:complete
MPNSQNNEHLFINKIFEKIGFKSKIFIEIGAWPNENNCFDLALNKSFDGLYIDPGFVDHLNIYDKTKITFENCFVNSSNINDIISKHFNGEIDLLSIDVDGVDLYLLDSIKCISPRIICIEYNASLGKYDSLTVKYRDDFDRAKSPNMHYCNASLKATVNLAKRLGYKYVGNVYGLNAFFVKEEEPIAECSIESTWQPHQSRIIFKSEEAQYNEIISLDWIEVSDEGFIIKK